MFDVGGDFAAGRCANLDAVQAGGQLTTGSSFILGGENEESTRHCQMQNGNLTVGSHLTVTGLGTSAMDQTGGTVVANEFRVAGSFIGGDYAGTTGADTEGTYNLSGAGAAGASRGFRRRAPGPPQAPPARWAAQGLGIFAARQQRGRSLLPGVAGPRQPTLRGGIAAAPTSSAPFRAPNRESRRPLHHGRVFGKDSAQPAAERPGQMRCFRHKRRIMSRRPPI
jgi:hypothetical protein